MLLIKWFVISPIFQVFYNGVSSQQICKLTFEFVDMINRNLGLNIISFTSILRFLNSTMVKTCLFVYSLPGSPNLCITSSVISSLNNVS